MKYLSIDPSINNVGFAILQTYTKDNDSWDWGVIETDKEESLKYRLESIYKQLFKACGNQVPDILVVEYPTFRGDSKGQIAAQKGYTIDLALVCGYLMGRFGIGAADCYYYTPQQWKGTRPKKAVEAWFLRSFGEEQAGTSEHAYEAAMMLYEHIKKT